MQSIREHACIRIQRCAVKYIDRSFGMTSRRVKHASEQCPVCLDDLTDCMVILACGHAFHRSCAIKWTRLKKECPICRAAVVDKRAEAAYDSIRWYENVLSNDVDLWLGMDPTRFAIISAARGEDVLDIRAVARGGETELTCAYRFFRNVGEGVIAFALLQRLQSIVELLDAMDLYDAASFNVRLPTRVGWETREVWRCVVQRLKEPAVMALCRDSVRVEIGNVPSPPPPSVMRRIESRALDLQRLMDTRRVLSNNIHIRRRLLERIVSQTFRMSVSDTEAAPAERVAPDGTHNVIDRVMSMQSLESMAGGRRIRIESVHIVPSDSFG